MTIFSWLNKREHGSVNKHIGDEDIIYKSIYTSIDPYHSWVDALSEHGGVYNLEFSPDG